MTTYYIRLLTYNQACDIIEFYNEKFDDGGKVFANITMGGVFFQGDESHFEVVLEFLQGKGWRYELSTQHPRQATVNIIKHIKERKVNK